MQKNVYFVFYKMQLSETMSDKSFMPRIFIIFTVFMPRIFDSFIVSLPRIFDS